MREIVVTFDPERKLFLYFTVLAFAVLVGPFGTYEAMTFWQRVMFWSLDILGGMAILVPIMHVFYASRFVQWIPSLPRLIGGIMLGALPGAAFITLLFDSIGADLHIPTNYPVLFVEVTFFSTILLLTEFVVWPLVFGTGSSEERPQAPPTPTISTEPPPQTPSQPRLSERLPPELRHAQILSISMQDHYAQIITTKGEHLQLIRLSDAIDLLDGLPGLQIHRSHWVASDAAKNLTRDGRRHELHTTDGRTLPVSAARVNDVKDMLATKPAAPSSV